MIRDPVVGLGLLLSFRTREEIRKQKGKSACKDLQISLYKLLGGIVQPRNSTSHSKSRWRREMAVSRLWNFQKDTSRRLLVKKDTKVCGLLPLLHFNRRKSCILDGGCLFSVSSASRNYHPEVSQCYVSLLSSSKLHVLFSVYVTCKEGIPAFLAISSHEIQKRIHIQDSQVALGIFSPSLGFN